MPEDQVKIEKGSNESIGLDENKERFPYGTSVNFDEEMMIKLGVENLAVGDVVEVRGFAYVENKSEHSNTSTSDKNMSFQFTTMKMRRETGDRVEQLYGPNS